MADNYSDKYLTASEEIEKKRRQQGEEIAAAQERENQAYVAGMEAAQAANQAALNQSQQNYNNLMAKYDNDFAAMVQGESDRIRKEQEDARTMIQADQQAAKWTGLTELASSVANMIGVGSFNAVSQQYKPYSQDWMRKADQDMREHRYRLDNIRARQNALKQQQLQLRMGQAGDALAREQQRIDRDYANARELAGIRRDAALAPLQTRAQYDAQADQTRLQGVQGAAGLYNQEEGRRLQERAQNIDQAQFAASMAAKGLNADGTPNEKLMADHAAAAAKVSGANKGGIPIKIMQNGQEMTLNIEEKAYQNALERGIPDLKEDVIAMARKTNKDIDDLNDIVSLAKQKNFGKGKDKKANPMYNNDLAGIAALLNKPTNEYTEEDWDAIANFAKGNYDKTEKFNTHLLQVSNGGRTWEGAPKPPTNGQNPPAPGTPSRWLTLQSGNYDPNNPWYNQ